MVLHATEPIGSDSDPLAFELDCFERHADDVLELRGRWFGVRGRRFMRPTLTMEIDGARHRLLADLEHKPWAAEEGAEWVASFTSAPDTDGAEVIELSVASDIVVALSPPGSRAASPSPARPAPSGRRAPAGSRRTARRATERPAPSAYGRTEPPGSARPAAPPGPAESDRRPPELELERLKARDLRRALEGAESERGRLAAQRDALSAERDAMRQEQARDRAEMAELQRQLRSAETSARGAIPEERFAQLRSELGEARAEREAILRELSVGRERVAELKHQLKKAQANTEAIRAAAQSKLDSQQADVDRLRKQLQSQKALIAERDRLARELREAAAQRDRIAAQTQTATPHTFGPDSDRIARAMSARPASRAYRVQFGEHKWPERALAVIPLCLVLLILAIILHLV